MSLWEAALLGLVQGATEFLPVSSSGHLVLTQSALGLALPGVVFEVALHVATLISVVWAYNRRIAWLIRGMFALDGAAVRYLGALVLATLPAALLGLLAGDRLAALFEDAQVAAGSLLVTGLVLWSTRRARRGEADGADVPGWRQALLIGLAQALALVPGISRAGMTVAAGLFLGLRGRDSARFSFLMAIPAIGGAAVLSLPEAIRGARAAGGDMALPLAVGFLVAAVTGVVAIRALVGALTRGGLHWFAPYCWLVGGIGLLWLVAGGWG